LAAGALALAAGSLAFFIGAPPACEAAWALNATVAKKARVRVLRSLVMCVFRSVS
jgi:hypothetical protein